MDILTSKLPKRPKAVLELLGDLLATLFSALLAWRCYIYIGEEYDSQLTSSVLFIPVYPFIAVVFLALVSLGLLWLINLLQKLKEAARAWNQ